MSADPVVLDPEFEAVLREVAQDPDSVLLRVPRPKVVRGLYERSSPVSPRTAGLNAAERQLVQVYRCEVAWLLRQACLTKLVEGRGSRAYVNRHVLVDRDCTVLPPDELRRRVDHERAGNPEEECREALELLALAVSDPFGQEPTIAALAAASHRLEPTNEARILAGMDLETRDAPRSAVELLGAVLDTQPGPEHEVAAWNNLGFAYGRLDDHKRESRAYRNACTDDPFLIPAYLNRLLNALLILDTQDVMTVSRTLDDRVPPDHPAVERAVMNKRMRKIEAGWLPTEQARRFSSEIKDSLGPTARRIADVFA